MGSYALSMATSPSSLLVMFDSKEDAYNVTVTDGLKTAVEPMTNVKGKHRHNGHINMLFADVHLESREWRELNYAKAEKKVKMDRMFQLQPEL